jgi:putative tryptophan/tyrosine transport system substrate-binding protein
MMVNRRQVVLALGVCALAAPLQTLAQPPLKQVARIGYLTNDAVSVDLPRRDAFKQGLRDLGYIEGQNLIIDYSISDGDDTKLPMLMGELLRLHVDVVFAFTTQGIQTAKHATTEIPIVFAAHTPVELGFVASLRRPGGNMTGLSLTPGPEIYGKQLQLLTEVVPNLRRVAALSNPLNPVSAVGLQETQTAAVALGVTLLSAEVKGPDHLNAVFTAMKSERAEAFIVLPDAMFLGARRRIAELGIQHRLPSIFSAQEHVEAGGLMGYGVNRRDIFRRAATYVAKILRGAKPADLPIEQPMLFDLVVNMQTATALGLKVASAILVQATRVIE